MKIELAYPWTDDKGVNHKPDTKVDLPEAEALQMIRDGRARPAEASKAAGDDKNKGE